MFIKVYPIELITWRSHSLQSEARFWNPYNFSSLQFVNHDNVTLNLNVIARQLEASFNFISNVYSRGGHAWFYNMFPHDEYPKRDGTFGFRTIKFFNFGVSYRFWFPGKLSNYKFLRKMRKVAFKNLFRQKMSIRLRPGRYRYIAGRKKNRRTIRRNYMTPSFWDRNDPDWSFKSSSRRKSFSRYLVRSAFFRFKNLLPRYYVGLIYKHRYLMARERRTIGYFPSGKDRAFSYFDHRGDNSAMPAIRRKLNIFAKHMYPEREHRRKTFPMIGKLQLCREMLRSYKFFRRSRTRRRIKKRNERLYRFLTSMALKARRAFKTTAISLNILRNRNRPLAEKLYKLRKKRVFKKRPFEFTPRGIQSRSSRRKFSFFRNSKPVFKVGYFRKGKIRLLRDTPKSKFFRFALRDVSAFKFRAHTKRIKKKGSPSFSLAFLIFEDSSSNFFSRPSFARSNYIYDSFIKLSQEEVLLRGPIEAGTQENPVDLPITKMPTNNPRRLEKIRKKLNPPPDVYDTEAGKDFKLFASMNTNIMTLAKLEDPEDEDDDRMVIDPPIFRYAKYMLNKRYASSVDTTSYKYLGDHVSFELDVKSLKQEAWETRNLVYSRFFKRRLKYKRFHRWYKKISSFSDKIYRLAFGLPALTLRGLTVEIPFVESEFHVVPNSSYKRIISDFYNKFKYRTSKYKLLTLSSINKPRKRIRKRQLSQKPTYLGYYRMVRPAPKLGLVVRGEKTYKTINNKAFKKFKRSVHSTEKRSVLSVLVNSYRDRSNNQSKLVFNLSPVVPLRRKGLFSGRNLYAEKYYVFKKPPTHSLKTPALDRSSVNITNRLYFTDFLAVPMIKKMNMRLEDNKRVRVPQHQMRPPRFIKRKRFKSMLKKSRTIARLRKQIVVFNQKTFNVFPSAIVFSNLNRLTLSIIGEARSAGICSTFFCPLETSPVCTYNVVINSDEKALFTIDTVYKRIFARSKIYSLIGKL